jgi:predicted O-methyltransferase YrrM
MHYWNTVYKYFRDQDIPEEVLNVICISSPEAEQISSIIEKTHPKTILEVGTFIGLSTGVIALASPPESTIVCVDANLPVDVLSAEFNYAESRGTLVFVRRMLEHFGQDQRTILLEGFFSHLSKWAREQIIALGGDPEQATIIGEEISQYAPYDLVFIDGDHYADAVYSDLFLVHQYVSENGIIVLHDVSGRWGEQVHTGVAQFIQAHPKFSMKTDHNLGFLSRNTQKAWFVQQKSPSLVKRVKWKLTALVKGSK